MPDGTQLASGESGPPLRGGQVRIWEVTAERVLRSIGGASSSVGSVDWSPADAALATTGFVRPIRICDPGTGETLAMLSGHTALVGSVRWSPDGSRLASGSYDQTVRIWGAPPE